MPLVPPDSPLRLVPVDLDRKAVLFYDGIRYSLHIFDIATSRLAVSLADLSRHQEDTGAIADRIALAISDAWMLVDSAHRLRELVEQAPRLRKNQMDVQLFFRRTAEVEELRHHFQHFRTRIESFVKESMPLWGTLTWACTDHQTGEPKNFTIAPGSFFEGVRIPMCTFDTLEGRYVERILLQVGPIKIDLATLIEQVTEFAAWYTEWFRTKFPHTDYLGADMHACFSVKRIAK